MNINGFIWSIADDVLHHVYDRTKYRDIILPMTVIRRLDAVLEPTRAAVLARKAELDAAGIPEAAQGPALDRVAGQAFHNRSPFTLRQLLARPNPETQKADFEAYLDGFSENVREVIARFKFRDERRLGMNKGRLTSLVRLSYLGPEIVRALLAGSQSNALTPSRLLRLSKNLPHDWKEQRCFLGFAA